VSRIFAAPARERKNIRRMMVPAFAMRVARRGGARELHTKLSGVTVIFFLL
jgi:hypothetical protein